MSITVSILDTVQTSRVDADKIQNNAPHSLLRGTFRSDR